ncbi:DUF2726 domain-containing protein [Neptuniibacter halophilus]|uniref:DUF2726 domain-containing protein n=1 Tax=Neptuniibacter halophilus TaxID=651666 RepID=UPI0025737EF4|nr:DUF2726 domain-containing protein [Neptuniibacter halophilus]
MIEFSWIYLLAGLLFCAIALFLLVRTKDRNTLDTSLSHKEKMFSSVLEKAVGDHYLIHCKVPMNQVLQASPELTERARRRALKPLRNLQFDYVVSDIRSGAPVCAVELDDHEFDKKRFKKQDLQLEELCHAANLPLLRVAPQNGYNLVELIERFERTIEPVDYPRNGRSALQVAGSLNTATAC